LTTTNLGGSLPIILFDNGTTQSTQPERKVNLKGPVGITNVNSGVVKKLDLG
jgi:hypothetical protein